MPSWPPRLHLGSSAPGPGPKSKARALKSPQYHEDQIEDNTYREPPLHGVPVIAFTGTSSPSRPSHGRSYSHPFPSIFGSGKKAEKMSEPVSNDNALKTLTESSFITTGPASKDHLAAKGTSLQDNEKQFVTGKCMTCDSRVRWPRHLDVFRCTVCLMVNDLKPGAGLLIGGREAEGPITTTLSSSPESSRQGITNPRTIAFL